MTISQVSKMFNLSQDTLRYYERIGLIPPINRNKSGNRDYNENDCKCIEFIKCMRSAGLSIEVLIEYISLFQQGDETLETRKEILVEQQRVLVEKMEELKNTIERLDGKIDKYDNLVSAKNNSGSN